MANLVTSRGRPMPLGVSRVGAVTNFAVLSRHGTAVTLVVFPDGPGSKPVAEVALDPRRNRTGDHWHIRVEGLPRHFRYGYRVDGPKGKRHRFDPSRVLIDPFSTMISDGEDWAGSCEVDPERTSRRSLYVQAPPYNWGDDAPPLTPHEDTVVYEVHVRGFTKHPSSGVSHPGTFLGLIEKLPYLRDLGVTAIELLPVHEFDECDCPFANPETGEKHTNFWGYNTIAFAAVKSAYAATGHEQGEVKEFRDLVKRRPRTRHRSLPRRGVQPHRRGRRPRPDLLACAASTTSCTTCWTTRGSTSTSPAAATPSTATTRWSASKS